jgi:stage V sporulation protein S
MDILRVSTKSSPNAVAGAIAGILREQSIVCVQVIGAGALNQAIKAIAIARAFVEGDGIAPVCVPAFHDVDIDGESRTAIRLIIEDRNVHTAEESVAAGPLSSEAEG